MIGIELLDSRVVAVALDEGGNVLKRAAVDGGTDLGAAAIAALDEARAGIVRRLIWRIKSGDESRVQGVVNNDFSAITIDHVLNGARSGDGVSISVVRDTAKYLGMAAANLVAIVDPDRLVLGGIVASAR